MSIQKKNLHHTITNLYEILHVSREGYEKDILPKVQPLDFIKRAKKKISFMQIFKMCHHFQ